MKYRKKPVVVEAYKTDKEVVIHTLEGDMKASIGDYIITGVNGEQYPCKPDIFEKTYEVVKSPEKMTNYEYIRDMSVDEMADFLAHDRCKMIKPISDFFGFGLEEQFIAFKLKQWLESEESK